MTPPPRANSSPKFSQLPFERAEIFLGLEPRELTTLENPTHIYFLVRTSHQMCMPSNVHEVSSRYERPTYFLLSHFSKSENFCKYLPKHCIHRNPSVRILVMWRNHTSIQFYRRVAPRIRIIFTYIHPSDLSANLILYRGHDMPPKEGHYACKLRNRDQQSSIGILEPIRNGEKYYKQFTYMYLPL